MNGYFETTMGWRRKWMNKEVRSREDQADDDYGAESVITIINMEWIIGEMIRVCEEEDGKRKQEESWKGK
jgi:hypothetical protein